MSWKRLSFAALAGLVACIVGLYLNNYAIFGAGPITITIQVIAALLMIWARLTFGIRSFHGTANPTAGGLVTTGPYRYIRHPICAGDEAGDSHCFVAGYEVIPNKYRISP